MKRPAEYQRLPSVTRIRTATDDLVISPAWLKVVKFLGHAEEILGTSPVQSSPITFHIRVKKTADVIRTDMIDMIIAGETRRGYVQTIIPESHSIILLCAEIALGGSFNPDRMITM